MTAGNDWRQRERLEAFSRLENLILREMAPEAWDKTILAKASELARQWAGLGESDTSERITVLAGMYRLSARARVYRAPREYLFWLLTTGLHMDAHVGPGAVFHRKEYLGPLWDRLEAIQKNHGWPDKDENGDSWNPNDHLDRVPKDYAAWEAEFERVADEMERAAFRATCQQHGVPEIAAMKEDDPEEYGRRCRAGKAYADRAEAENKGQGAG